jgi:hypothetical protein
MFYVREILHVYRYILELETTWVRKVKKMRWLTLQFIVDNLCQPPL